METFAKDMLSVKARITTIEENGFKSQKERDETIKQVKILTDQVTAVGNGQAADRKGMSECADKMKTLIAQFEHQAQEVAELKKAVMALSARTGNATSPDKKVDFMNLKSLVLIPSYSGKHEEYGQWTSQVRNILSHAHTAAGGLLKWAATQELEPDELSLDSALTVWQLDEDLAKNVLEQTYHVLLAKTSGSAFHLIQGYEEETCGIRGAKAWWKLKQHAQGMSSSRMFGLLERIGSPPRVGKLADLQAALDAWEALVREYESVKGKIGDMHLVRGLMNLAPSEQAHHMATVGVTVFAEAKSYLERQISLRREAYFREIPGTQGPGKTLVKEKDKMDVGACQDLHNHMQFAANEEQENGDAHMQALGKGGSFQGFCDACGKWGHRWRDCRSGAPKGGGYGGGKGKGYEHTWGASWEQGAWSHKGKGKDAKGFKGDHKGYGKSNGKGFGKFSGKGYNGKGKGYTAVFEEDESSWTPTMCSLTTVSPKMCVTASEEPAYISVVPKPGRMLSSAREIEKPRASWVAQNRFAALQLAEEEDEEGLPPSAEVLGMKWEPLAKADAPLSKKSSMKRIRRWGPLPSGEAPSRTRLSLAKTAPAPAAQGAEADSIKVDSEVTATDTCVLGALVTTCPDSEHLHFLGGGEAPDVGSLDDEWELLESMVDSGASACVASPTVGAGVPISESEGSKRGQVYYAANGAKLANKGEKRLAVVTEDWDSYLMTYQMADVIKPLTSVSKVCDAGGGQNTVTFTSTGGYIFHAESNKRTHFARENGVYVLRTWVKRPSGASPETPVSFARQGASMFISTMGVMVGEVPITL